MSQLHKRFSDDQVRLHFGGYCQGLLGRASIRELLGIRKTRFFALVKEYREDPVAFSIAMVHSANLPLESFRVHFCTSNASRAVHFSSAPNRCYMT